MLRSLPMFAGYSAAELERADSLLFEVEIADGDVVMREGQPGREAFIIVSGTAEVLVGGELAAYASVGDIVGEMALLESRPRSATVVAITPLRVLVMGPQQFRSLLDNASTAMWVATVLSNRLRDAEQLHAYGHRIEDYSSSVR